MTLLEQFQQIFGERIKARRRELRLTQLELSGRLQISRAMLANIETGAQRTSVFLLARLAQILEVSTEDLVPDIVEAEARFKQSRKISLATEIKPVLLSRELEALNISVGSGATLEEALKEVRLQNYETKTIRKDGGDDG
jgi:transcriptional regulator with XRE-family HTH domain